MVPLSLVHNLSLLVSLSLANGFLLRWLTRKGFRYQMLSGLIFGAAALVGMATPVVLQPGLIFDGRSIVLGIAGLFGGPVAALLAALMTAAYRIHLGGPGTLMGVMVITSSALLGVGAHLLRRRWPGMDRLSSLLGLGFLIHVAMLTCLIFLPGGLGWLALRKLGLAILLVYPLAFMLVGVAFVELERHFMLEGSLRASEERFRSIFEQGTDGILMFDISGTILEANEAFAAMRGYTRSEVRGMSLAQIDAPSTQARMQERMARLLAGETLKVELEQVHRDGHRFLVEASAARVFLDGAPVILSIHRDITERARAQEALAASEARMQLLLDSTAEGIYGLDLEGRCTFCNAACLRMTGYAEPRDLLGRNMHDLIHHTRADGGAYPLRECRIGIAIHEGKGIHTEGEVFCRADGSTFSVEYWSYPQWKDGRVVGAVVTFLDITERLAAAEEHRRLEAQVNQAHKMESLGSLAGGIAHDMNNVLAAILGLASASQATLAESSPLRSALDTIHKAAQRGGLLVKGLLNFARRTAAEQRELNLNDLLREEAQLLERTTLAKVQLHLDLEPCLEPVLGDGGSLGHAVMNLCVNAVDAMPEGGVLTLRTRNRPEGSVELRVTDTGTGMPPEILARAMDPFFTTKDQGKGTGLGLSLVYSTVKAHGGHVELASEPGRGTSVTILLPSHRQKAVALPDAAATLALDLGAPLTVLLVDDDELIQGTVPLMLEALGHQGTTAARGEEALARLEGGETPDLVILDMNMPGLGGAGTLPRLRILRPTLPVLLATGRADQEALNLVASDPHTSLLAKPFTLAELRSAIAESGGKGASGTGANPS